MAETRTDVELPEDLRRYFWEYDTNRLSWETSRHTIVTRLLQSGGLDAVQWLRRHLTDEELREFLVRHRGRGIGPRRLRFWGLVLGLPRGEVDDWIAAQRSNPWQKRVR